jgi:hypothetical protein
MPQRRPCQGAIGAQSTVARDLNGAESAAALRATLTEVRVERR